MFEHRRKVLLAILLAPVVALVLRLAQLQIVRAGTFRSESNALLIRPAKMFPCLRGEIQDRQGRRLAYDAPAWDIALHYGVMSDDEDYLHRTARDEFPSLSRRDAIEALRSEIAASWKAVVGLTGEPIETLTREAEEEARRVRVIKELVSKRRGVETVIAEELMAHAIYHGLDQQRQVTAKLKLAGYPWFEVVKSHTRRYEGGPAVGHILGWLGPVDDRAIEDDPSSDDPLARYQPADQRGIRGVEALAEQMLRGTRGRVHENIRGEPLSPPVEPVAGGDVRLAIDLELQQAVYERLAAAVEATPYRSGGCAILLDIPTRQILAMVGYPSIDPDAAAALRLPENLDALRRPWWFRAVAEYYAPGSIAKPMILAAALADGTVTPETRIVCQGRWPLDSEHFKCSHVHGELEPVGAIQHSCNVFFYQTGQQMGIPRITRWMSAFGFARRSGTGLPEEKAGGLPEGGQPGEARNLASGQGEIEATPIQVANMIATVASGEYRPVTLMLDDGRDRPAVHVPVAEEHWRLVREGMYKAVNEFGGTAYGHTLATLRDAGPYVLLGKTGSAQGHRRVINRLYTCAFPDGTEEQIVAANHSELRAMFPADRQPKILGWTSHTRWPDEDPPPTHAWFAGYLAPRDRHVEPADGPGPHVAVAVVIEYGGKGGETAGPVGRDIMQAVLERWESGKVGKWESGKVGKWERDRSGSAIRNSQSAIRPGAPGQSAVSPSLHLSISPSLLPPLSPSPPLPLRSISGTTVALAKGAP